MGSESDIELFPREGGGLLPENPERAGKAAAESGDEGISGI